MRKWAMLFVATLAIAVSGLFGVSTSACACVEPIPENELRALIRKADKGDVRATGQVWQEYALVREDAPRSKVWASRAIRAGDPDTMEYMADRWMWEGQRTAEKRYKLVFYDAAVRLLENGYRNRGMIAACDTSGANERFYYIENLRSARAALKTAREGPEKWIKSADKGNPSAACHVANHYFWVDLNQQRRGQWERRASELGDPMFAGNVVDRRPTADDIRDIIRALRQKAVIAKLGDRWVQAATISALQDRLVRTRHFASGKKNGQPNGLNCVSRYPTT